MAGPKFKAEIWLEDKKYDQISIQSVALFKCA